MDPGLSDDLPQPTTTVLMSATDGGEPLLGDAAGLVQRQVPLAEAGNTVPRCRQHASR